MAAPRIALVMVFTTFTCLGCASTPDRAHQLRAAIREANKPPSAEQLAAYRSTAALRGARWGMTPDELSALKGEPVEKSDDSWLYREPIDGVGVESVYVFADGHLAEVRTRWLREQSTVDRLEAALIKAHGAADQRTDKVDTLKELQTRFGLEQAAVLILAAFGGRGGGWWWGSSLAQVEIAKAQTDAMPLRTAVWKLPETSIWLVTNTGETTLVTWRSRMLGRALAERDVRSLEALSDKL